MKIELSEGMKTQLETSGAAAAASIVKTLSKSLKLAIEAKLGVKVSASIGKVKVFAHNHLLSLNNPPK